MADRIWAAALVLALGAGQAGAQEVLTDRVAIELNAVDQVAEGCRISFLIRNAHAQDIDSAVYEAVLFDAQGRVDRLTLFDFGALPAARPRVRQFVVPGLACDGLGQVLINGATACTGDGVPAGACIDDLQLGTRTDVEMLG